MSGATLALTPQAHEAMSLDEMADLGRRLVELHARASVIHSRRGWMIRVHSWAEDATHTPVHRHEHVQPHGHLADVVHAVISTYEQRFVFSPDELATIRKQSAA